MIKHTFATTKWTTLNQSKLHPFNSIENVLIQISNLIEDLRVVLTVKRVLLHISQHRLYLEPHLEAPLITLQDSLLELSHLR